MIELYNKIADDWRNAKGNAAIIIHHPINPYDLAINVINKMRRVKTNTKVLILCGSQDEFHEAREHFANKQIAATIVSLAFVKPNFNYTYDICITVGINSMFESTFDVIKQSHFKLVIVNKVNKGYPIDSIKSKFAVIDAIIPANYSINSRVKSPIEEYRVSIPLLGKDLYDYNRYTEYITQSINIFGNFDNINKARIGDKNLNMSATEYCYKLAIANGWNENISNLDEFSKAVDDCYNPNTIHERAGVVYNIMRERSLLLTDNDAKLEKILDIVNDNPGKKILIVSRRGEFARKVTKYLHENNVAIGDYHDCIEPMNAYDSYGCPILVKSGANKGKPKIIKARAISTNNLKSFNLCDKYMLSDRQAWHRGDYYQSGCINVLSIKNSSSDDLECAIDLVIFTSSLCDNWEQFIYRFNKLVIPDNLHIYKIYFANTVEEISVKKVVGDDNYIIHEEEKNLNYDENTGNIVL